MEDLAQTGQELGLTKEQAQDLIDAHARSAELPNLPVSYANPAATEAELRREWGSDYEERMKLARWAVESCGEHAVEVLGKSGLGNDPRVIRFFSRLGARAVAERIQGNRSSPYWTAGTRDHLDQVAQAKRLYQFAARTR